MSRYDFEMADANDDAALRRRMAEDVLDGKIAVTFRREPRYFAGTALQGNSAQVMKCVSRPDGRIVGLFTRAQLQAYVNGDPATLGYLCDLRADASVRGGTLLARGYRQLRALHEAAPIDLYYTMILDGNETALSILTSGRASLPAYRPLGKVLTPALHLDRRRHYRFSKDLQIVTATSTTIQSVIDFVNEQYRHKQFAPVYTRDDLGGGRFAGLQIDDVYVAVRGGRIVGCVACWDQSRVRQIVVERYNPALRLARPLYNVAANVLSRKALPRSGEKIPFFYLAWIAIEDDDRETFRALLEHVYEDRRRGPWHFMFAGLHERSPIAPELESFRHIASAGHLFAVHWPDGRAAFEALDQRVPHIEIGAL